MQKEKKSFILYSEYSDLIDELSDEEVGQLFRAVFQYQKTGEVITLNKVVKMAFVVIKQDLDRNTAKYEEIVEKRKLAGSKGGKQKADNSVKNNDENLTEADVANANFAKKNIANLADNDNDNVNDNDNDNVSLLSERGGYRGREERNFNKPDSKTRICTQPDANFTDSDKELIENYVRKNKLATKNVRAYVNKIIENGDGDEILKNLKAKTQPVQTRKEKIKQELASIKDKRTCARVLSGYYMQGESPPDEFEKVMKKYELETYDMLYDYSIELEKQMSTS